MVRTAVPIPANNTRWPTTCIASVPNIKSVTRSKKGHCCASHPIGKRARAMKTAVLHKINFSNPKGFSLRSLADLRPKTLRVFSKLCCIMVTAYTIPGTRRDTSNTLVNALECLTWGFTLRDGKMDLAMQFHEQISGYITEQ